MRARNVQVDEAMAAANPGAQPGPHVLIAVADNGSGIPPEVRERIFDPSAFCSDDTCANAPSGRNAYAGPGLVNLDVSVSRVFHPRWAGEAGGVTLRADFFNFLNHANLNPPGNIPGTSGYGVALFGTPQQTAGFPSLVPLTQTARQIQLVVRLSF